MQTFSVDIELYEVVDADPEGFLDLLCERAGHPLLMDADYKVVGNVGNTLTLHVTGDTSAEGNDGATYDQAVKLAHGLMAGSEPGDNPEYLRGMIELIGDLFGLSLDEYEPKIRADIAPGGDAS